MKVARWAAAKADPLVCLERALAAPSADLSAASWVARRVVQLVGEMDGVTAGCLVVLMVVLMECGKVGLLVGALVVAMDVSLAALMVAEMAV